MSPLETTTVAERVRLAWRMRLSSALRTAAACAIIGVSSLYGPKFLTTRMRFSAFSYLTAVLIVSDATLGDTLRGCWHAFCATAQVVPLAVLGRWLVYPHGGMPVTTAAAVAAVASFLVALPECTHLTAKKIAFGQIVLICTDAVLVDGFSVGFRRPLCVAACTALGALASILALLLPYPGLASLRVKELSRVYAKNASERMKIYLRASTSSAAGKDTKMVLMSKAKLMSETGAKLLKSVIILEDGLRWERPWRRVKLGERLRNMELQMRGIEYSLASSAAAIPIKEMEQEQLSNALRTASTRIEEKIEQLRCYSPFHSKVEAEITESIEKPSSSPIKPKLNHSWLFLYFSCIEMFHNGYVSTSSPSTKLQTQTQTNPTIITTFKHFIKKLTTSERLEFAFKCSVSLSLSVLLGSSFDKENGCWAGLIIAISFVTGKQALFTIANSRVQGTAIGSIYGVICCFIFHREELKLLALLPWIIFTHLLRYGKMYGQTGGVSAAIGALVILGRENYGIPDQFAIVRLTEVFIGLSVFIVVELFLKPIRAATLAKSHMLLTLRALQDCIKGTGGINQPTTELIDLIEKQRNLTHLVSQLKDYVADAEMEPHFWYLPFRASCYQKLLGSFSNIRDMLCFISHNFELLSQLSESDNGTKYKERINHELEIFQRILSSTNVYQEEAGAVLEEEMEAGNLSKRKKESVLLTEQIEAEWAAKEDDEEDDRNMKERAFDCLSTTGFCINSITQEIEEIEICLRQRDQL